MRTAILMSTLALLACTEEPNYHHEPSLSIHGGWEPTTEANPNRKWIGGETIDRTTHDGCVGERTLTAEELEPACTDCAVTLVITDVDDSAWCDVGAPGPAVGDVITFQLDDATQGTLLLDAGDDWTPYATGELVDGAVVYERLRGRQARDFDPDDLRQLGDEPPRL